MIPIRDANPTHRTPFVTLALIALTLVAFFLWQPFTSANEPAFAGCPVEARGCPSKADLFVYCHGAIPQEISSGEALPDVEEACEGKSVWLSILTSMFMHGGLLHLGGNLLYLWIFGNNVEDRMGRGIFLAFYLAAGVAAVYAQVLAGPSSEIPLIGASGAIAGTLGAYLVMFPRARVLTLIPLFFFLQMAELPAIVVLGFWFVLQAFQGVGSLGADVGGVAWWAHIGGFAFGAAVALLFYRRPRVEPSPYA